MSRNRAWTGSVLRKRGGTVFGAAADGRLSMNLLSQKAWSPYAAGILIGLLQIPAFLLIETALGTSSSYVTVSGMAASWIDPQITQIDYVARHLAATGKNWWQVALVIGIAIGAFVSMRLSGSHRQPISPIWE